MERPAHQVTPCGQVFCFKSTSRLVLRSVCVRPAQPLGRCEAGGRQGAARGIPEQRHQASRTWLPWSTRPCRANRRWWRATPTIDRIRTCNLRLRRPETGRRNKLSNNDLRETRSALGVSWECSGGTDCQCPAAGDAEFTPSIQYIADAWPHLQPHVREAIFTLIDAALDQQKSERGQP